MVWPESSFESTWWWVQVILYQRHTLLCSSSKKRTASAHVSSTLSDCSIRHANTCWRFYCSRGGKEQVWYRFQHTHGLWVLPITFSFRYDINVHVLRNKQSQTLYTFLYKKATYIQVVNQSESCLDPWIRVTLGWGEDTLLSLLFCPLVAFAIHLCKAVSPLCQRWQIPGHSSSWPNPLSDKLDQSHTVGQTLQLQLC